MGGLSFVCLWWKNEEEVALACVFSNQASRPADPWTAHSGSYPSWHCANPGHFENEGSCRVAERAGIHSDPTLAGDGANQKPKAGSEKSNDVVWGGSSCSCWPGPIVRSAVYSRRCQHRWPRWWSSYWLGSMPLSCTRLPWLSAQTSSINSEVSIARSWFLLTVLFNVGWGAARWLGYEWIGATADEDGLLVEMIALIPRAWLFLLLGIVAGSYYPWTILAHWGMVSATVKNRICWFKTLSNFQSSTLSYSAFWVTWCQEFFASCGCSNSSVSFNNKWGLTPITNGETLLLDILFLMRSGIMLLVAIKLLMLTPCRSFKIFF